MFSQKKKKSKGLLFLIPVLLVFLAGLALNAFMSGGAEEGGSDGNNEDRLVSAGYGSNANNSTAKDTDGNTDGNTDENTYNGISGESQKASNNIPSNEYTDNVGGNKGDAINGYADGASGGYGGGDVDSDVDITDGYYYGSDPYSEMYDDGGASDSSNGSLNGSKSNGNGNSGSSTAKRGYSGYRAISENNILVIYKYSNGSVVSEKRTDIQTDILPEYDREMLENGIDISSESAVDELLQDYEG